MQLLENLPHNMDLLNWCKIMSVPFIAISQFDYIVKFYVISTIHWLNVTLADKKPLCAVTKFKLKNTLTKKDVH